ncbi:hypothetical protein [Coprococcus eutactus]|uniref:hypothetical protein n=1 Tax=Coprococcus eutactus TaxID=33043 RepID=UPI001D085E02|nr:hypothetical protein [Coprococcus eutactus]MCB6629306.1 hypothetical protein [Coprococcus eutactus]MCG4790351.1 hypothetical protein [Coprococcus eutactus]MCQ5118937.1 hypothetical protein [Coprococcus eutactus]MCQ5132889.1 hypothetical protein [Coprococcus eutactus]MCQ5135916.1 hypothetical protein [Coprococcus eutactus]
MDENNTNGFGNTDDEYEDEGTTVLTTPGVSAFANAQGAGQSGDASDGQPHPSGQPEQQNMYSGFGQFQQPGQPEQQNMYSGFGQFQQPEQQNQYGGFNQFQQPGQPEQQNNQYGGFSQFQQPGQPGQQNNQYGGFNQSQQPGQPEQQNNQYGGFNQFQQPGQQNNQYGGFNQFQQPGQQNNQYGGFNQFQQPGQQNQYGQPGPQAGVPQGADMKPGMKLNKKLVAIIGGIVAVVIIVIIVLVLALSGGKGQRSATKIGDELAKAYENGDADAMIELMKDDYYELYNETWGDNFVEDQFNEDVQDMKEEVGTVKSIKIEDRSEEKYEKDEIEDVNKTLDRLNVDMKVDDCLEIDMDVEIKGSEDDADGKITYTVVKSGSKWYLVDYDLYVY